MRDFGKDNILRKLERVKKLDKGFGLFAAHAHRYELNPVLTKFLVNSFETEYRVRLPADYRWFLCYIGDGGPGPDYGVMPLNKSFDTVLSELDEEDPPGEDFFSTPFQKPGTPEESKELWYFSPGMLPVCDGGCGMYCQLCLSGHERGNMWFNSNDDVWYPVPAPDDRPDEAPVLSHAYYNAYERWYAHLLSDRNKYMISFLDWYLLWLQDTLMDFGN